MSTTLFFPVLQGCDNYGKLEDKFQGDGKVQSKSL